VGTTTAKEVGALCLNALWSTLTEFAFVTALSSAPFRISLEFLFSLINQNK
jgi:hypothetical protein